MERSSTTHAPRFSPHAPEAPPAPRWRLLSWSVGLGTLLLAGSVVVAALIAHSPSRAEAPGGSNSNATSNGKSHLRAVAIAFVDVEDGIRNLYPVQTGRVKALPQKEGEEVPEGTPLLLLDDAQAKINEAKAQVALDCARDRLDQAKKQLLKQHKLQIKAAKAAVDAAKSEKEAAQALADKAQYYLKEKAGSTSQDVRAAKAAVAKAEAGIHAAQAKLESLEAVDPETAVRQAEFDVKAKEKQLEEAKLAVKECTVLAPCKGKVLRTLARVGEVLGSNPKRPALEFCPSGARIVRAEVEQEFAYQVSVGQKARITDDARTNSAEWTGTVKRVSDWYTQRRSPVQEPMQFNDVRTMEVIIRLDNDAAKGDGKGALRIGQRVRVELDDKN